MHKVIKAYKFSARHFAGAGLLVLLLAVAVVTLGGCVTPKACGLGVVEQTNDPERPYRWTGDFAALECRANRGNKQAQALMGDLHFFGEMEKPRNLKQAEKWYAKAATVTRYQNYVYSPPVGQETAGRTVAVPMGADAGDEYAKKRLEALRSHRELDTSSSSTHENIPRQQGALPPSIKTFTHDWGWVTSFRNRTAEQNITPYPVLPVDAFIYRKEGSNVGDIVRVTSIFPGSAEDVGVKFFQYSNGKPLEKPEKKIQDFIKRWRAPGLPPPRLVGWDVVVQNKIQRIRVDNGPNRKGCGLFMSSFLIDEEASALVQRRFSLVHIRRKDEDTIFVVLPTKACPQFPNPGVLRIWSAPESLYTSEHGDSALFSGGNWVAKMNVDQLVRIVDQCSYIKITDEVYLFSGCWIEKSGISVKFEEGVALADHRLRELVTPNAANE